MINFQHYFEDCLDNEWDDLIQTYWNIQATAQGEAKIEGMMALRDQVMHRRLKLPPTAEQLAVQHPGMVKEDD